MTDDGERLSRLRTAGHVRWSAGPDQHAPTPFGNRHAADRCDEPESRPALALPLTLHVVINRLNKIAAIHCRWRGQEQTLLGAQITFDECYECGEPYPCKTRQVALGEEDDE